MQMSHTSQLVDVTLLWDMKNLLFWGFAWSAKMTVLAAGTDANDAAVLVRLQQMLVKYQPTGRSDPLWDPMHPYCSWVGVQCAPNGQVRLQHGLKGSLKDAVGFEEYMGWQDVQLALVAGCHVPSFWQQPETRKACIDGACYQRSNSYLHGCVRMFVNAAMQRPCIAPD